MIFFGFGLAFLQDVNDDGYSDLAIGAPYERETGSLFDNDHFGALWFLSLDNPVYPYVESMEYSGFDSTESDVVEFAVSFSKNVLGVDASDFELVTEGISGASIVSVTGQDKDYVVTVNTGTGHGKLILKVVDDNSIEVDGVCELPLGGYEVGDGTYTGYPLFITRKPVIPSNPVPADGASDVSYSVLLDWTDSAYADSYDLYLWRTSSPKPAYPEVMGLSASEYRPRYFLSLSTDYKWQVVAYGVGGTTAGPEWSFTVQPPFPGSFALVSPSDGELGVDRQVSFDWTDAADAAVYDLYLWKTGEVKPEIPTFADIADSSYQVTQNIENGSVYKWQVHARNFTGVIQSEQSWFETDYEPVELLNFEVYDLNEEPLPVEPQTTDSQEVRIEIQHGLTVPDNIMISESPDFAGANWQSIKDPITYRLSSFDGEKTLYAKIKRYLAGESSVLGNTIVLQTDDNSEVVSHDIWAELAPDQDYMFSITMKNTGQSVWPEGWDLYRLGRTINVVGFSGDDRYPMPQDVYPDHEVTIDVVFHSPVDLGDYALDFQMVKEWQHWFGEKVSAFSGSGGGIVNIREGLTINDAQCLNKLIPVSMNQYYINRIWVDIKNIGHVTWSPDANYSLAIKQGASELGCVDKVDLNTTLIPGDNGMFFLELKPLIAGGPYRLVMQMQQNDGEYFGEEISVDIMVVEQTSVGERVFELYE